MCAKTTAQRQNILLLFQGGVSFVFGLSVFMAAVWCNALLLSGRGLSQALVPTMATASICLASAASGWLLARLQGQNGLLCGCTAFAVWFLLLCLWNGLCGNTSIHTITVLRVASMLLCAALSGFWGMLCAEKAAKHRSR